MAKLNTHFVRLVLIGCLVFAQDGFAASSVKRFGTGNIYTGTSSAVTAKSDVKVIKSGGTTGRASSVRTIGTGKIKPATIKTTNSTGNTNTARLSVGKYLHSAGANRGIIKPVNNNSSGNSGLDGDYYTKSEIDATINEIKTNVENLTVVVSDENTGLLKRVETTETNVDGLTARVEDLENASGGGEHNTVSDWCDNLPTWLQNDDNCN